MKPPIIPHQGRGIDTVNFRNIKESESVDLTGTKASPNFKGAQLDSKIGNSTSEIVDPFEEFNSVTLHHEEEDNLRAKHSNSGHLDK